jgi:hypothetical protein
MRVWIAQCLCPQRHCILAAAGQAQTKRKAEEVVMALLKERIAEMIKSAAVNPWCGICYAPAESWHYEVGRTPFARMQDAMGDLERTEAANIATGLALGELGGAAGNRGRA